MTAATDADLAALFTEYAKAARGTALKNRTKGDSYGEMLATARRQVYEKAAKLVRDKKTVSADDLAAEMMLYARQSHIRTAPMMNFDAAGIMYATARAWQLCAWKIDPSLPEVQPLWD